MSIDAIRRYLQTEILSEPAARIDDDEDLLLSGTLDSLRVMRLVQHLEGATGIVVPPEDVTLENFSSLRRIDAYLDRRRVGPAPNGAGSSR
jgi:acyl carrier protein